MQQEMPSVPDDSSNVIRFKRAGNRPPIPNPAEGMLVELLTALNGQSLQSVFSAMDLLQFALDQVEATHALLPDSAAVPKLREERVRLSCELFAARMMTVRLSSTLAQLRQAMATSRQAAEPEPVLRMSAPGN